MIAGSLTAPLTADARRLAWKTAAADDLRAAQIALARHLVGGGDDAELAHAIASARAALTHLIAASSP